jgi:hypothetical protein
MKNEWLASRELKAIKKEVELHKSIVTLKDMAIKNLQNETKQMRAELEGEFTKDLEKGYEEAYQMLKDETKKTKEWQEKYYKLAKERPTNEEYEQKLNQIKEHMVDKINEFLKVKDKEAQKELFAMNPEKRVEHVVKGAGLEKELGDALKKQKLQRAKHEVAYKYKSSPRYDPLGLYNK